MPVAQNQTAGVSQVFSSSLFVELNEVPKGNFEVLLSLRAFRMILRPMGQLLVLVFPYTKAAIWGIPVFDRPPQKASIVCGSNAKTPPVPTKQIKSNNPFSKKGHT